MSRCLAGLMALWLLSFSGCGGDSSPPPAASTPAAAPAPAAPAMPAAPAPAAPAPATTGTNPAQPTGAASQPYSAPQPMPMSPNNSPMPNPSFAGAPGAAPQVLFVPFPPFVITPVPTLPGTGPTGPGAGAQPNPMFVPGPMGVPPGGPMLGGPNSNPGGIAQRAPASELEAYVGPELFAVSPNGKLVVTYLLEGSKRPVEYQLKLWDLSTGRSKVTLESADPIQHLVISPDGNMLATVSGAGDHSAELTLWELPGGTKKSSHNWNGLGAPSFASDGKHLVAAAGKKAFALVELDSGKVKRKRLENLAHLLVVQASPVEPIVAVGRGAKKRPPEADKGAGAPPPGTKKKDLDALRQQAAQRRQQGSTKRDRNNPAQTTGAPANTLPGLEPDAEGVIEIIDLETGKVRKRLYVNGAPTDLAFNFRGTVLAAFMAGGQGGVWDTASWIDEGKLGQAGGMMSPTVAQGDKPAVPEPRLLAISPAGDWGAARQSAAARAPGELYELSKGQTRAIDPTPAYEFGFLPNGVLVLASREKPLRFFELPAMKEVYPPFSTR